ncbi:MAG: methyl-accepting chemotaxis protein [Pseudomonadota bacterium]
MNLFARLPVWLKISFVSSLVMASTGAFILVFAANHIRGSITQEISDRQRSNIEIAATLLAKEVATESLQRSDDGSVERIVINEWPSFAQEGSADHSFIDFVTELTNETATIFAYDVHRRDFVRRTTNILTPDNSRAVGTYLGNQSAAYEPNMAGETYFGQATILGTPYEAVYMPIFTTNPDIPSNRQGVAGILYVGVASAALAQELSQFNTMLILIGTGALALAAVVTGILGWRLLRPLGDVMDAMRALADGEHRDIAITRKDEIGEMQASLAEFAIKAETAFLKSQVVNQTALATMTASAKNNFKADIINAAAEQTLDAMRQAGAPLPHPFTGASIMLLHPDQKHFAKLIGSQESLPVRERVSWGSDVFVLNVDSITDQNGGYAGPLVTVTSATQQMQTAQRFEEDLGSLMNSAFSAIHTLRDRVVGLEEAANSGSSSSEEATEVAAGASEAVQSVASAIEELTGSFGEVAQQIHQNVQLVKDAARASDGAAQTARDLESANQRISEVVELIADVAGQTNLLALNATIEASRAGEAGRGFAVVASEVKSLAGRAAKATNDISAEVQRIKSAGDALATAMSQVQNAIGKVDEVSASVASAVEEQQVTADEISRTVHDVAQTATRVRNLADSVKESAGRTGSAAGEVSILTAELDETGSALKERADGFLQAFRQAA